MTLSIADILKLDVAGLDHELSNRNVVFNKTASKDEKQVLLINFLSAVQRPISPQRMQPAVDFETQFQLQVKLKQMEFDMEDKRADMEEKRAEREQQRQARAAAEALELREFELRAAREAREVEARAVAEAREVEARAAAEAREREARAAAEALEFRQVELRLQLEIEQQKVLQVQGQPPVQRQQVFNVPTASKLVPRWDGKSDLDMYLEVFEKTALANQ